VGVVGGNAFAPADKTEFCSLADRLQLALGTTPDGFCFPIMLVLQKLLYFCFIPGYRCFHGDETRQDNPW